MPLKICVLGSGSEGNCTLVYSETTAVLVDAGFSCKKITNLLQGVGFDPARLNALLITHEHSDHVRGARVLSKRFSLPVYLTEGTLSRSKDAFHANVAKEVIRPEQAFTIGDIEIDPFTVPHDATDPVAFLLSHEGRRALVLTDIGAVTVRAVEKVRQAHLALIESNHDPELLKIGPYPWPLKERIRGGYGHLSNDDCAELLESAGGNGLGRVIFGHLSKTNNNPDLVRITAKTLFAGKDVKYAIATQHVPTETFVV